jgi:hypothetical protein
MGLVKILHAKQEFIFVDFIAPSNDSKIDKRIARFIPEYKVSRYPIQN